MARDAARAHAALGRHHLIVSEFDYGALRKFVQSYCDACIGIHWNDVAEKLGRLGHWEYEDMKG